LRVCPENRADRNCVLNAEQMSLDSCLKNAA